MSYSRRAGSHRRPGRPLLGAEPLSERLTVTITPTMKRMLDGKSPTSIRAALVRAFSGRRAASGRGRRTGGRGKRVIHRFSTT